MNEIITRLLDWCYEHDYAVNIYINLKGKYTPLSITLYRNGHNVQHVFDLGVSENENKYPSTKWFDENLDYELQSFLEWAEDEFSRHEAEVKNDGEM